MKAFFTLVVTGALLVSALWAAQFDMGPVVINRADEYRIVLRLGQPIEPALTDAGIAMTGDLAGMKLPFRMPFIRLPFLHTVLVLSLIHI